MLRLPRKRGVLFLAKRYSFAQSVPSAILVPLFHTL